MLAAIEGLWQAAPGTLEHDRLEVLAMLVDDYESRRWPIAPTNCHTIRTKPVG